MRGVCIIVFYSLMNTSVTLSLHAATVCWQGLSKARLVRLSLTGFDFPRGPGHMPLDLLWAPRFFRLGAQNSMMNNQKSSF